MLKGRIELNGMEFFAHHGCLEAEKINGNKFVVDISFTTDIEDAAKFDKLEGTIDYSVVYQVIGKEMEKDSALLENLAWRIKTSIESKFPQISGLSVKVSKLNPPLKGTVRESSVTI